jgi:lipopolysaccharide export system permease protein
VISTLDRYIIKEVALTWSVVTGLLLLILVSNRFALLLGEAAAGKLPAGAVLTLLGLVSINYLAVLIPAAMFVAAMVALGRLYRDSEMATLMACGVGPRQLYRPLLMFAGVLVVLVAWLSLQAAPWAVRMSHELRTNAERAAQFGDVQAGRFKTFSNGNAVFYAQGVSKDGKRLENVFVEKYHQDGSVTVVKAASGHRRADAQGSGMLVLVNGYRYDGVPGEATFRVVRFNQYGIHIKPSGAAYNPDSPEVMSSAALWRADSLKATSELQWRLSLPVSVVLLTLLALPLAKTTPRQGRFGKIMIAILAYVIYSNLVGVARIWLEKGATPPALGIWWVHGLFLLAVACLLARQNGVVWRVRRGPRLKRKDADVKVRRHENA